MSSSPDSSRGGSNSPTDMQNEQAGLDQAGTPKSWDEYALSMQQYHLDAFKKIKSPKQKPSELDAGPKPESAADTPA